ncbi:MAG TPA: VanZ family protein [Candidatus Omnitrophota bacterium]|nr:VanZ family protein [Candidatus Omnitrophota bacterium]
MSSQKRSFDLWKIIKFWFPLLGYSAIIFCVSSLPSLKPPFEGFNVDKFFHMLEYIPFGYLAARALFHTAKFDRRYTLVAVAVLFALLYGISDEIHQSFVEGRFASVFDVIADTLGGMLGGWLFVKVKDSAERGRA